MSLESQARLSSRYNDSAIVPLPPPTIKSNIIESLVNQNDIAMVLCSHLDAPSFLNLYCISKTLHHRVNTHMSAFIRQNARRNYAEAARIFPFQIYRNNGCTDPMGRKPTGVYQPPNFH